MQRFGPRWRVSALLIGAFVLKLVVLLQLKDHPLTAWDAGLDTTAYVQLAQRVLAGAWGLGPALYYVSPFYIYFLAALLAIGNSFTVVRLVQILLGTTSVGFIFSMTRAWFGGRAAWIAAVLASLTGLFTFYEVLILQSSVDAFFTSAALYALTRALVPVPPKRGSYKKSAHDRAPAAFRRNSLIAAGLTWGVETLNRPNVVIAVVGVAIVLWIVMRRLKPAALLIAGLLAGIAPVAIRNVVVAGQWTLVSSHGGLNFYIGNSERATGFYQTVEGITPTIAGQEADTRRIAERALGRPLNDAEVSQYFTNLGLRWIGGHPVDASVLFLRKLGYAFHAQHIPLPHSYPFYAYDEKTALRFCFVGPWLLTPLGLVGLVWGFARVRDRRAYTVFASFVPCYAIAVAIFFIAERYRLPLMVPLCVGAGAAIDYTVGLIQQRNVRPLLVLLAATAALFVLANRPIQADDGRWLEGLRLAQRLVILKRYDEADRWAARLDASKPPRPAAAHAGVGLQLMTEGEPSRALPYLEEAHRLDPREANVAYALGRALLAAGRAQEALEPLRQGFDSGIALPNGGLDYAIALHAAGNLDAALAAARRVAPPENEGADGWLRLGRLAAEQSAPAIGDSFFRRGAEMAPHDAAARQQYGLNLLVLGRFDDAARELNEAVRLDPRNADSLSRLAYCEARLNRRDAARTHAQMALAVDPSDRLAQQLLAALR